MADFDVAKVIEEFLADPTRNSLELPHMTTGQRRNARKLAEARPEQLKCESYGFGQERQLHLFKRKSGGSTSPTGANSPSKPTGSEGATSKVNVKNTFIDDWSNRELEPVVFRSTPAPLNKQLLEALDTSSTVPTSDLFAINEVGQRPASEGDVSTSASAQEQSTSEAGSPGVTSEREMPKFAEELQVRNTFIHIDSPPSPSDERAVQSMPHGMFGLLLAHERSTKASCVPGQVHGVSPLTLPEHDVVVTPTSTPSPSMAAALAAAAAVVMQQSAANSALLQPGARVFLQGLLKLPEFNGRLAVIDSWEEEVGRYAVSLEGESPCKAKVRPENVRPVAR